MPTGKYRSEPPGSGEKYQNVFNLPGPREGSQGWYLYFGNILEKYGLKAFESATAIFGIPGRMGISTHVDDGQVGQVLATEEEMQSLKKHLEDADLKIKVEGPCNLQGGVCCYLKRLYASGNNRVVVHRTESHAQAFHIQFGFERFFTTSRNWKGKTHRSRITLAPGRDSTKVVQHACCVWSGQSC